MARLDRWLFAMAAVFGAFGILMAVDLAWALGAESCAAPFAGSDCYPWGTEGPSAGAWSYASKQNYLLRGFGQLGLTLAAAGLLGWCWLKGRPLSAIQRTLAVAALAAVVALFFA